jgi:hypothetical protein
MIRCPACGAENRPSTKFCAECGASLAATSTPSPADDRTVLLPPQPARAPGTIEQAMRAAPDARRPGERPPPTPPDNDMTVILPKKSAPPPKYEPAPPTVTGPLTEPIPHGKSSRSGSRKSADSPAMAKPKTPIAVVLALVAVAGGSAGYLGWLVLKKNTAPSEKVAVAPPAVEAVKSPPTKVASAIPPAPPTPAPAPPVAPALPAPPVAAVPSPTGVATPPDAPAVSPPPPAPSVKAQSTPAVLPVVPPAEPVKSEPVRSEPPKAEPAKAEPTRAEKAKAEQLKKDQARLDAAKRKKEQAATQPGAAREQTRPAEAPRPPAAAAEPARQEPTPLALLRDDLRACDAQSIFSRENCKNQARQRRCAGLWDRVPECPYKKELY